MEIKGYQEGAITFNFAEILKCGNVLNAKLQKSRRKSTKACHKMIMKSLKQQCGRRYEIIFSSSLAISKPQTTIDTFHPDVCDRCNPDQGWHLDFCNCTDRFLKL